MQSSKPHITGTKLSAAVSLFWDVRRIGYVVVFVALVAVFGLGVYAVAFRAELDQASERGRANLALSSDRLTSGMQRYRELGVMLSDHPVILTQVLSAQTRFDTDSAHVGVTTALLQSMADKTGAEALLVLDAEGRVLAHVQNTPPLWELRTAYDQAMERAMNGALGMAHFVDASGTRRFIFATPVFAPGGAPRGAVLALVGIRDLEWSWPANPTTVYFTDEAGVVFVTNRSELILAGQADTPFPLVSRRTLGAHTLFRLNAGPYIPTHALHLEQSLPILSLTGELLLDLAPVRSLAALQAGMAAALCFAFGALLFLATERRRTLADANARLEARVATRTAALENANRELKRAQSELVQAGKLSALGQMSAGISHELNQPLMAIRSFAENGQAFLERDNYLKANENLGRISELARRMGRIIKNLRAFARQENEKISDVELNGVVDAALEMAQGKISEADVQLDWQKTPPIWVRGGEVRLQQVVMNLVSNAVDAMVETQEKRITIRLNAGDPTVLRITDTGPGIAEPDKIFDPFYTTKEVGASEGMGLGLSISYGLIQSFGGEIRGTNRVGGGAEFLVHLTPAKRQIPPQETAQ